MLKKFNTPMKSVAILSLVLAVMLNTAWAVTYYKGSTTIEVGGGGKIQIVDNDDAYIVAKVREGSLDDYLKVEALDEVTITVKMTEELAKCKTGTHYHLNFTFGPSGAYFAPPLQLTIAGKYVKTGCHVWLYDENGEALEGKRYDSSNRITFEIPHFSSYYYDDYDY